MGLEAENQNLCTLPKYRATTHQPTEMVSTPTSSSEEFVDELLHDIISGAFRDSIAALKSV